MQNTIILWDDNPSRICEIENSIKHVLSQLCIEARIQINCEMPLLSRNKLIGKTPAIQITDDYIWSCSPDKVIPKEQIFMLFKHLKEIKILK